MYQSDLIRDLEILNEKFIPDQLRHREKETEELKDLLLTVLKTKEAVNAIVHGPPGTGKTTTAKIILREFRNNYLSVITAYVNCWETHTAFKTLHKLVEQLNPLAAHRKGTAIDEVLDSLTRLVKDRLLIVVMDEADKLENDSVIYKLLEKNIPLILIANDPNFYLKYDFRVQSRLHPYSKIIFNKYSLNQLTDILLERVNHAIMPSAINRELLEDISDNAAGDARKAISILKNAVLQADKENKTSILKEHIKMEEEPLKQVPEMNDAQELLLRIIKDKKEIRPRELYKEFTERSIENVAERTIRNYLQKLEHFGRIISVGEGRWRVYKINS